MPLRSYAGGRLFAEVTGSGPEVLALHGWGRDGSDLRPAVAGVDAILPDLPGFGRSPAPEVAGGAGAYARVVAEALDEAGVAPIVVLGHSFGGRVAVKLAADRPDLVRGVVLTGVPLLRRTPDGGPRSTPPLRYRLIRWGARTGIVPQEVLERARDRYGSADYRAASGVMREVLVIAVNEDYGEDLVRIQAPVVMCWGSRDTAAPVEQALRASTLVPDLVAFHEVDCGHDLHKEAPDVLPRALADLLDR